MHVINGQLDDGAKTKTYQLQPRANGAIREDFIWIDLADGRFIGMP